MSNVLPINQMYDRGGDVSNDDSMSVVDERDSDGVESSDLSHSQTLSYEMENDSSRSYLDDQSCDQAENLHFTKILFEELDEKLKFLKVRNKSEESFYLKIQKSLQSTDKMSRRYCCLFRPCLRSACCRKKLKEEDASLASDETRDPLKLYQEAAEDIVCKHKNIPGLLVPLRISKLIRVDLEQKESNEHNQISQVSHRPWFKVSSDNTDPTKSITIDFEELKAHLMSELHSRANETNPVVESRKLIQPDDKYKTTWDIFLML